ncbi:hypothetical protein J5X84_03985 [Streptosporangiaceae bacterium NEAU-GS5]|nr:hypothetical protein [Streptosporangiaceae bacterium NEAU-GS5]
MGKDLGVNRETLCLWVRQARENGTAGAEQKAPADGAGGGASGAGGLVSSGDALEEQNKQLKVRIRELELELERDILRKAAKYVAGETNW